ncbi:LPS-assembly protein LptD [Sphingomonas citricola]|uniref:LPS-assembly protein LptD n=1 Tax=Sphingomonas citricola TaxID=2862498 RepID=UPI0027E5040D|nr:LPS assembly protein LptD [Sphingomonas citricola]
MKRSDFLAGCVVPIAALCAAGIAVPAAAQSLADRAPTPDPALSIPADLAQTPPPAAGDDQVQFSSSSLEYDYNADIVTALGDVRMTRSGEKLRAERVVWNRKTGRVVANGNVGVTNPQGDVAYGDSIELTDTLKDGVIDNLLVVLERGGRLAAVDGRRDENGTYFLNRAAYSPCPVTDASNCPKEPTWKITAVRVTYRPDNDRVYFEGARFNLFGLASPRLPRFSTSTADSNSTGLLTPGFGIDRLNGVELTLPFNVAMGQNRSLVIAPHIFTNVVPLLEARYSEVNTLGAFSIAGYATSGRRSEDLSTGFTTATERAFRGYLDGTMKFQFSPEWSLSGSLRMSTDRTFTRRYDISDDDRLRSTFALEHIEANSYFAVSGWATQTLRVGDRQSLQPVALPEIDYRRRVQDVAGGVLSLQANTLAIGRKAGQDTQRAFASAEWNLRRLTNWGQEVTLTAFARGDAYNTSDAAATAVASYRGLDGFQTRAIGAAAIDVKWPFIGELFGGTQRWTPRVQIVASPHVANLRVPNEDSRAVDLEDSNLFALNRFPGYDRWEDSSRITYGGEWAFDRTGLSINATIGQSYRLDSRPTILPSGTGLSDSFSDIVGRTNVRLRDFITFTHRYRLDKDNFAIRRNEVDATVGSYTTYATVGYLRLNRNIDPVVGLQDREEIRLAGRAAFARFWSVFGSAVIDLTDRAEDVLSSSSGFDPIRHRLGVAYEDDCLELGVTWRRDYRTTGDIRAGNSYLLTLAFKGLGR